VASSVNEDVVGHEKYWYNHANSFSTLKILGHFDFKLENFWQHDSVAFVDQHDPCTHVDANSI
jgi:hypothetical protein